MSISPIRPHSKWPVAVGLGIAGSLIVALVVLAFLWPAKATTPQHLPVSISGPAAAVTAVKAAVAAQSPETFEFLEAADREGAIAQIQARESYGAIILAEATTSAEVLTAPAANAVATQMLNGIAAQVKATVTPIVPLSASDPAGSGLAAASFPLMMGGMIGGILISSLVAGGTRRIVALLGFGISVGLVLTVILQTWFQFLQGDFWLNAIAIGLAIVATSSFIVGCASWLGTKGIAVGAVTTMLIGSPLSSAAMPWQFLPEPWGAIGQYFVPGASNALIRSLSYFPDANNAQQW
ncbi:hypothetical protein [Arthrobacter psychrolactophilus]